MEAWTSTAQLKAAPDTESVGVGGGAGLKRAQEKGSVGEKRTGLFSCLVIDPFLTVESNKL